MTFPEISQHTGGEILQPSHNGEIRHLLYDSRRPVMEPETSLFFAIRGERHDGHTYLEEMYRQGVCHFVVESNADYPPLPGAAILRVDSSVRALQSVARARRKGFTGDVIGITGSNGKTIVKEWLFLMMTPARRVVKSPSSFNSQIGVPLSVWQLDDSFEAGIFEAGISRPAEMEHLETVIQPTLGIFTNIGPAHDEGFESREQKIAEKLKLFVRTDTLIYCRDHEEIHHQADRPSFTWGEHRDSDLRIIDREEKNGSTTIRCRQADRSYAFEVPFTHPASLENAMHAVACMLTMNFTEEIINAGLSRLRPLHMRLEVKQGQHGCYLIDDTYNNDLAGLRHALEFLSSVGRDKPKVVILSDILQSGLPEKILVEKVNSMLKGAGVQRLIGIGEAFVRQNACVDIPGDIYPSTKEFLDDRPLDKFREEAILIKGARPFQFEKIVRRLEEKIHGTVLEVDLGALVHNLNFFRSKLSPGVRVMVMVKAFAYGSGITEVANLLQYHRVDYLGVAYADEGVHLRRNGINIPVMVMNPAPESFDTILEHNLEPEIYSLSMLQELKDFLNGRHAAIHLKLETGMHRLGFDPDDLEKLTDVLKANPHIHVRSLNSHLAASESEEHEAFSRKQSRRFEEMCEKIEAATGYRPMRHLLNSSGIIRYPELQYDMVRLGIGLYGIEGTDRYQERLLPVSRLKTVISQIREVAAGESVGYGRAAMLDRPRRIATIAIGYADGFSRMLSQGRGYVVINGQQAPVVGNVCMDMTMVDVTGTEVREGDAVEIFGPNLPLQKLAAMSGTIPYEILTNVSQRVKRVFYRD